MSAFMILSVIMALAGLAIIVGLYRFAKAETPDQEFWSVCMIFLPMLVILVAWLYGYKITTG